MEGCIFAFFIVWFPFNLILKTIYKALFKFVSAKSFNIYLFCNIVLSIDGQVNAKR